MSILSQLDRFLGTNLRVKPYLMSARRKRRKGRSGGGVSTIKFKHMSPAELTDGVYAVQASYTTTEPILQRGNYTEADHIRVVGKGYRVINDVKHEAILFENGTWDLSQYYIRLQPGARPASILNSESQRRNSSDPSRAQAGPASRNPILLQTNDRSRQKGKDTADDESVKFKLTGGLNGIIHKSHLVDTDVAGAVDRELTRVYERLAKPKETPERSREAAVSGPALSTPRKPDSDTVNSNTAISSHNSETVGSSSVQIKGGSRRFGPFSRLIDLLKE